jgi:hypothetical protein
LERGRARVSHCSDKLPGLDYHDGLVFQVLIVGWEFLYHFFCYVWGGLESLDEVVHRFSAPYCVSRLPDQIFEVADVLVNEGEAECVFVEGRLRNFLFSGVGVLSLEVVEEVGIDVFDVLHSGVELF